MEKWLYQHYISRLCQSSNIGGIEEAVSFIEDIIDDIDDLSDDAGPRKDVISVLRSEYEKFFPVMSKVYDSSATEYVTVKNVKFDMIPQLLNASSIKKPVVITSVRRSDISNRLSST